MNVVCIICVKIFIKMGFLDLDLDDTDFFHELHEFGWPFGGVVQVETVLELLVWSV